MFRNDPLESLKVSSTFDSIPFVRDYLQKEIEGQLRTLLMDELPAIIHRLSLRLWVPEYRAKEDEEIARNAENPPPEETPVDPLASPPQDPVDMAGNTLDPSQIASLSLDSGAETHSLFSQKNLLRLSALTDSHRTLSLFTPGIRDAVFRAWAGPTERGESTAGHAFTPNIPRSHSYAGNLSTTYTFSDGTDSGPRSARPTLSSYGSAATGLTLGSNRSGKPHGGRKRKHRIVNLRRRNADTGDLESVSGEGSTISGAASSAPSEYATPEPVQEQEGELATPPKTPEKPQKQWQQSQGDFDGIDLRDTPPRLRNPTPQKPPWQDVDITPRPSKLAEPSSSQQTLPRRPRLHDSPPLQRQSYPLDRVQSSSSTTPIHHPKPPIQQPDAPLSGIWEQAWMTKIAGEIVRRAQDEKNADQAFWDRSDRGGSPPPAYGP